MLKEENGDASKNWARRCDTCQSAASTVYCRADAAYLCTGCDARIHAANLVHEREWVCESCERAPAVFLCKADAASLCTTCDAIIHSANPLARRHRRIPIFPIPYGASAASPSATPSPTEDLEEEASSWLLLNPVKNSENQGKNNDRKLLGEVDGYLDLNEYHSCQEIHITDDQYNNNDQKTYGGDSFVQVQYGSKRQLGLEYEVSDAGYVGVVPESRLNEVSSVSQLTLNGTVDLFSSPPIQLSAVDREARVLRYREKKKRRKFEKKIRYASRKAYAETRPRIKGRFAKRTDVH